ncbi:MAG: hypothetical protein DHS20C15_17340 [Planctomycetota bacterium]|nr:MAG: hypothetical protein DHS20C15_17340 [Planctomycetota bacterium]
MDPIKKIDDPRLTAYALGELQGEDAAAVERFLADNPDARAAVDELRALGDTLSAELANESAPRLSQSQRDAISAQAASDPERALAPVIPIRAGRQFAAAAAVLLLATASFWILPGLLGDGEEGSFRYELFGSESAPHGEVAMNESERGARGDVRWSSVPQQDDQREGLAAMGDIDGDTAITESLDAPDMDMLRSLGYVGSDEGPARSGSGESPRAGKPSSPNPPAETHVSEQLGVAAGDPASGEKKAAGFPSPFIDNAGEPSSRFLHMGPVPRTSTAGMLHAPREGNKPQQADGSRQSVLLGASVESAAPPAPSNSSGAASGGLGKLAGRAGGNPNAGVVFEDGGGQVFTSESEDFFGEREEAPKLSSGPLAYPLSDTQGWFKAPEFDAARRAGGEGYAPLQDNAFVSVVATNSLTRLSTFGVDVDRASYSNVRRFLQRNQLPPADAVRLEELVNAFEYSDLAPAPDSEVPFAVHVSSASAPWAPQHRLVRVALKGRVIEKAQRPPAQLTFLVDVSGSMQNQDKLPLLKQSLRLLVEQLDERDHVALVTYASGSKVVLPSTSAGEKATILAAIDALSAGGSTHASAGLQLAYQVAEGGDVGDGGTRRVLLCTDGDFNVGVTSQQGLHDLIAEKAKTGTFLTVLGFGSGNYQDVTAETLADRGNGQYAYIDGLDEAHHVFVRQLTGTLVTIAQDVKLQLEFNPAHVRAWRQLGYENRKMAAQDFRNDKKDAGEIGAGHSVVAYYEIVPSGAPVLSGTADLKYEAAVPEAPQALADDVSPELLTVNLRWKHPGAKPTDEAAEFSTPFTDGEVPFAQASDDFRFGAAVLAFGMALRSSPYAGHWPLSEVSEAARAARGNDPEGQRAEFVNLALRAQGLLPAAELSDIEMLRRAQAAGLVGDGDIVIDG